MTEQEQTWLEVDRYLDGVIVRPADVFEAITARCDEAGLPAIAVSPSQGKLLHVLARMVQARNILEIGTLGGYSTVWLATAMESDGRLITLEYDERHADVARRNIAMAGLADRVEIRVGAALDTLPDVAGRGPFDMVFIDADKPNNKAYIEWALKLSRPGGVIVLDNVIRDGEVIEPTSDDPRVISTRAALELFGNDPRLVSTAVQTVGAKGWDGFAIAWVGPAQSA